MTCNLQTTWLKAFKFGFGISLMTPLEEILGTETKCQQIIWNEPRNKLMCDRFRNVYSIYSNSATWTYMFLQVPLQSTLVNTKSAGSIENV